MQSVVVYIGCEHAIGAEWLCMQQVLPWTVMGNLRTDQRTMTNQRVFCGPNQRTWSAEHPTLSVGNLTR